MKLLLVVSIVTTALFGNLALAKSPNPDGLAWLEELQTIEEGIADALKSADPAGLRSGSMAALKMVATTSSLDDQAHIHCAMAAQSLANFAQDIFMSDASRGKAAAQGDFRDYRGYLTDCEKAVGHKIKRHLQVRF